MGLITAFARLNKKNKAKLWEKIKAKCESYPEWLEKVPTDFSTFEGMRGPKEVWCSRGYLVQIFDVNSEWECMAIARNAFDGHFTRYLDGITWDKIQELKAECGREGFEAMEIYPREEDVHNVNHRYLWVKKRGSFMREMMVGWTDSTGLAKPAVLDLMTIMQAGTTAPESVKSEESGFQEPASSAV